MQITRNWKGKKKQVYTLPEKSRQRILKALQTRKISEKVLEHTRNLNKGKFGKNHPCYKKEKKHRFHKIIRETYKYRKWRKAVFEEDNYTCVLCGYTGYVEADHYPKQFIEIIWGNNIKTLDDALNCKELWEAKGRTLCRKCHIKNTDRLSKRKWREKSEAVSPLQKKE